MRRLLTPRAARRRRVRAAAAALFHEKGVHGTVGRTGILVHVSLLERDCEVIADAGVTEAVDEEAWADAVGAVREAVSAGGDALELASRIEALAAVLEPALPRAPGDVNELPDEACSP
jgi:putative membrane protein